MLDRLVVLNGEQANREYQLNFSQGPMLFGRSSAQANIAIPDPQMSRVHFSLEPRNDQVWVLDQGSAAGTLVNGRKIAEHHLKPGDIIRAGETQLRFCAAGQQTTTSASEHNPVEQLSGVFAHFQMGKLIARGTTGCVFKATDTDTGQLVALKVLFPELAKSEDEMQRFVRAMKTMMPLSHPNLITVLNAGRKDSLCWYSMEYIDGDSLSKLIEKVCREGKLPWAFSLKVAIHLSRALEYAESNGILHRNITPNNILIRIADQQALLGDLMLGKALEGVLAAQITKPGEIVGDVKFMSPERTRSTTGLDIRSEIYSLGATLYALLTGKPPFDGLTLVDTLQKIRSTPPLPIRDSIPSIPPAFEAAILKMLEKEPAKRFASATEMLKTLEAIANTSPKR
jgi:serine/threonine protein kinase